MTIWLRSEWRTSENNRRARYDVLTASGRRQLDAEQSTWQRVSSAINAVLDVRPGEA